MNSALFYARNGMLIHTKSSRTPKTIFTFPVNSIQWIYSIYFFNRKSLVLIPMETPDAANYIPKGIPCNIDMRFVIIQIFLLFKH